MPGGCGSYGGCGSSCNPTKKRVAPKKTTAMKSAAKPKTSTRISSVGGYCCRSNCPARKKVITKSKYPSYCLCDEYSSYSDSSYTSSDSYSDFYTDDSYSSDDRYHNRRPGGCRC